MKRWYQSGCTCYLGDTPGIHSYNCHLGMWKEGEISRPSRLKSLTLKTVVEWLFIAFWVIMGLLMISWAVLTTLSMWRFFLYGT